MVFVHLIAFGSNMKMNLMLASHFSHFRCWIWQLLPCFFVRGAVASWLLHSTPERAVWVRALARDIVLCSWARHFALTVPLSTQVFKWVPANCWGNLTNCGGVTCNGLASHPGKVEILPAASCYRNWDKLRQLWASLGSKASLTTFLWEFLHKHVIHLYTWWQLVNLILKLINNSSS